MKIDDGDLDGVLIVRPEPRVDERGFFVRTSDSAIMRAAGIDTTRFVQENQSRTRRGTVRGLHFRADRHENKLVRCARGAVLEHIVDLRPRSRTFGAVMSLVLDDVEMLQVLVPAGCAHGFTPQTDEADICYRHTVAYDPEFERAVRYDDPRFDLDWGLDDPVLSVRDQTASSFAQIEPFLLTWFDQ